MFLGFQWFFMATFQSSIPFQILPKFHRSTLSGFWYNVGVSDMCMLDEIRAKRDEIYAIARKHKAEKLWVFGSCARKEECPGSDVDFLVKWMPGEYSWRNECAMSSAYEKLLNCKVDLVSSRMLPHSLGFAHRVCKEAVAV